MRRKCRRSWNGCWPIQPEEVEGGDTHGKNPAYRNHRGRPFRDRGAVQEGFGLEEIGRGDSELAREVYLTDGYINVAIVCWKRTRETPNPYPEGYGLDHFGLQVDDLEGAEARVKAAGATPQPPPPVDLSKLDGRLFFREEIRSGRREVRSFRARLAGCRGEEVSVVALEASSVRKVYTRNGQPLAILDVERFSVREGELITVIGPSGCGKSTFLHILGGFIKSEAAAASGCMARRSTAPARTAA